MVTDLVVSTKVGWSTCSRSSECVGVRVVPHDSCAAHLDEEELVEWLDSLFPGAAVDARGVVFSNQLLERLLQATTGNDGRPTFGKSRFNNACFASRASFNQARFDGGTSFAKALFADRTKFADVSFGEGATFAGATFGDRVWFSGTRFGDGASFNQATFGDGVWFNHVRFGNRAWFSEAHFGDGTWFNDVHFGEDSLFAIVAFRGTSLLRWQIASSGRLNMTDLRVDARLELDIAAERLTCTGSSFGGGVVINARGGTLDFDRVTLGAASTIRRDHRAADADSMDDTVRVSSFQGSDVSQLTLLDVDLSMCRFQGTLGLDRLHFAGDWWSSARPGRRMILEELDHRGPEGLDCLERRHVASLYRQLRRALENNGDEPGAADFYYGEMEMRRQASARLGAERMVLNAYRVLSGYGLRAWRSFAALIALVALSTALLMSWGIPTSAGEQRVISTASVGQPAEFDIVNSAVRIEGSLANRWTAHRLEQSLRTSLSAVVFRDTDQRLMVAGQYVQMADKLLGPIFLAMTVLAVRARVKR